MLKSENLKIWKFEIENQKLKVENENPKIESDSLHHPKYFRFFQQENIFFLKHDLNGYKETPSKIIFLHEIPI